MLFYPTPTFSVASLSGIAVPFPRPISSWEIRRMGVLPLMDVGDNLLLVHHILLSTLVLESLLPLPKQIQASPTSLGRLLEYDQSRSAG